MSRESWNPVLPALAQHFDVIAVDLPGFGESEPLPAGVEPTLAALASSVAELLDTLDVATPHVAGNSLGGWVALELAHLRRMGSVTLLSPAGLWSNTTPLYCRISLRASRWLAVRAGGVINHLVDYRIGRILVLGQTHAHPARLTAAYARSAVGAMATSPGFEGALHATANRRYRSASIEAPVTIAFGSHDLLLLPWQSRHLDQLPDGVRVGHLPACGHVPMADHPAAVVSLITSAALTEPVGVQ
jgi:pimeloyl-ACP methyl ester carboxylesterase